MALGEITYLPIQREGAGVFNHSIEAIIAALISELVKGDGCE